MLCTLPPPNLSKNYFSKDSFNPEVTRYLQGARAQPRPPSNPPPFKEVNDDAIVFNKFFGTSEGKKQMAPPPSSPSPHTRNVIHGLTICQLGPDAWFNYLWHFPNPAVKRKKEKFCLQFRVCVNTRVIIDPTDNHGNPIAPLQLIATSPGNPRALFCPNKKRHPTTSAPAVRDAIDRGEPVARSVQSIARSLALVTRCSWMCIPALGNEFTLLRSRAGTLREQSTPECNQLHPYKATLRERIRILRHCTSSFPPKS